MPPDECSYQHGIAVRIAHAYSRQTAGKLMRASWTCTQDVARAGELQAATRQVLEESTRTVKEKLHTKGRHRKQAQLHLRVRDVMTGCHHARHDVAWCSLYCTVAQQLNCVLRAFAHQPKMLNLLPVAGPCLPWTMGVLL